MAAARTGTGDWAPDVLLTGPEGQVRLFTLLAASDRFAMLVLPGERANPALAAAAAAVRERWPDLLRHLHWARGCQPGAV